MASHNPKKKNQIPLYAMKGFKQSSPRCPSKIIFNILPLIFLFQSADLLYIHRIKQILTVLGHVCLLLPFSATF